MTPGARIRATRVQPVTCDHPHLGFLPTYTSEAQMTTHSQSEQIAQSEQTEGGVSRRGLVQALAAGAAAASITTPAPAQTSAQQGAVLAEATGADYARDPTRWGSA
jgi:hypothetical protein